MGGAPMGGGFDWNGLLGGAGFGMSAAGAIANFNAAMRAIRDSNRGMHESYETTAAQLRDLLGIATGDVLTSPGNDFVGGIEDPRSQYLATGTLVGGPSGGMNPLVVDARQRLFQLLQTDAISPESEAVLRGSASRGQGAKLEATARAPVRNAREGLSGLLDFAGGGAPSANIRMQSALANRAFARQTAGSGMNFLTGLYSAAGSTR